VQTFTARDGLEIAYDVSDFTDPRTQPDTRLLPHAAMGNSRLGTALGATIPGGKRGPRPAGRVGQYRTVTCRGSGARQWQCSSAD
jgi:hypothetical protein